MRVRHTQGRSVDDGYRSALAPGLRSTADAERLAREVAFAAGRLTELATAPSGVYADVASLPDAEEACWLAFLTAYLGPLDGDDPFAAVRAIHVPWASGELPQLDDDVALGPRTAHDPARGTATLEAYRAWARRAGGQLAGFTGEPSWTPERRFERVFERLALPGLHRAARFDLLVTLGRLGRVELRAGGLALAVASGDAVAVAAKRLLGIGDPLLLERRAAEFADACDIPLEALDLGLRNWDCGGERTRGGAVTAAPDGSAYDAVALALELV